MNASHKYLPLFVAEANEQLEALGSDLVRLEKEAPGPALWDSIFRRVHSVKGSAATLGFTGIVEIPTRRRSDRTPEVDRGHAFARADRSALRGDRYAGEGS